MLQQFSVLLRTYLAGKMPAPQEFHDSILYLIRAENAVTKRPELQDSVDEALSPSQSYGFG